MANLNRRPLAWYAIDNGQSLDETRFPHSKVVRTLLENGADPNARFDSVTLWQFTVAYACDQAYDRNTAEQ